MIRIVLFLITNLAVMFLFGIILSFTGIKSQSIQGLMIMAGLFGFGGAFISLLTSKWIALNSVGGKIIKIPSNKIENWIFNIVKIQANQIGIKTPDVAIYESESINAFATGCNRNSSLVAVSTGLLDNMDQNEIEAVIAHEMSHIANGDMVTMTLLQGIVNTFVIFISRILAQIISGFFSNNTEGNGKGQNKLVYFISSMILELIFGILASIITMWFSRYREFKADAGSAKLVGKEKMIAALKRLQQNQEPKEPANVMAFCINGKSKNLSQLFLSHPTLDKRIKALQQETYLHYH